MEPATPPAPAPAPSSASASAPAPALPVPVPVPVPVMITITVNGQSRTVNTPADRLLLDVLREDLGLTGTKYGCGEGRCGACTVLVDRRRERSCQLTVAEVAGKSITTIEGLASSDRLHPVQEAFLAEEAMQCGYCTPGMILSTVALLEAKPRATDAEAVAWLNGHLCRCCGYPRILRAVRRARDTR